MDNRIRFLLAMLTAEERALAWVQLNRFQWPDAISEVKSKDWDNISTGYDRFKTERGQSAWRILNEMTSDFDRSRAWWINALGRTPIEHIQWWIDQKNMEQVTYSN